MHTIWYDGSSFRLTSGGGTGGGGGTVVSVFGREGAVMPQAGDYTTDLINEGTNNLYFTNARVQAAMPNFTGDSGMGGARGTVPAPAAGDAAANKYLHADGTFKTVTAATLPSCMDTQGIGYFAPLGELTYASMFSYPSSLGANQGILHQFNVLCPVTFAKAIVNITAASGTGCTGGTCGFLLAIYNAAGSLVAATTPIVSGGSPDLNTTGAKVLSFASPVMLNPGAYWLSGTSDSTALRLRGDTLSVIAELFNADGHTRVGRTPTASTGNGAALAAVGTRPALEPRNDSYAQRPGVIFTR